MAIKIKGDTIINDGRIIVNADKIGIGTTNPQVALEIFNGDVGIGTTNPSASNVESALGTNENILAVGVVTAREYYGTFKGTIDPAVADDRIQQGNTKAQVVDNGSDGHFLVETEGSERLRIISDGSALFGGFTSKTASDTSNLAIKSVNSNIGILKVHADGGEIDEDLAGISFSHGGYQNAGNSTQAARAKAAIAFESRGGTSFGYGKGDLCFYVDNANDNNQVSATDEKLRITMDGDVGIGTTNPSASNIKTALNTNTKVLAVGIVTANEYYGTFKGDIDPGTSVVTDKIEEGNSKVEVVDPNSNNSAYINIVVAGVEKQNILSSGQVNIKNIDGTGLNISGSTTSGMELKVINASSTQNRDTYLDILNENDHTIARQVGHVQADGGSAWIWKTQISGARDTSRTEERLRITADGHVGIGTTNPVASNIESALEFNTKVLAVGIVTANEYYGSFKGNIDPGTPIFKAVKADRIKITEDDAASGNILFQSGTSSASTFNVTVTAPNSSFYTLSGSDRTGSVSGNNQPVTINVGDTINFNLSNVAGSHPFYIKSALGSGSNTEVSTPAASGQGSTGNSTVSWTPNTSGTYYYQCGSHSTMNGTITVRDEYFSVLSDNDLSYNSSINQLGVSTIKALTIKDSSDDTGTENYVIKADGDGGWSWGQVTGGSVGIAFTDLNDTPGNYTGHAHKLVRVNKDGTTNNGTALEFVNISNLSNTYDLSVQQSGSPADNNNPFLRLSDGTNNDDIEIVGGSNVTVTRNSATKLTIEAINGAGVGIAASVSDILNIHSGDIGAVDAGGDKIVFWDDDADPSGDGKNYGKLTYLSIDNSTLEIDDTTLKVKVAGVSGYSQEAASDGNNVKLRLKDIGAGTFDDILITKGDGITFSSISADGFKISASGGGNVATSIQTFTTAGTYTYTPTSGTTSIIVYVIGAGGASGTPRNYAWTGGGGAGGVAIKTYNLTELGANASVVVPDVTGYDTFPFENNGPNGANASFDPSGTGATIIGYGGKGSNSASGAAQYSEGGDGGTGSNGDINLTGDKGYVIRDQYQSTSTIVAELRVNAGSSASSYHINRAKAAGGGYGQYGLGGEATFTTANQWNNGRGGTAGAVIVYEFAGGSGGSGSGGGSVHVQDEGTELSGIATTLNFTGALVQATNGSDSDIKNIAIEGNFTDLLDTPSDYTGQSNKFVRVNAAGDGLQFSTQTPTTGAAGDDTQVQYNDGSTLQGAKGLSYIKGDESDGDEPNQLILKPNYTDYTSTTDPAKYGGGSIVVQSNDTSSTSNTPWNFAGITADGGLELRRTRIETPQGGPYIDFKAQSVDMDARIQMDYALYDGSITPTHETYSTITFQTGGKGYYHWQNSPDGRLTEKIRIGRNGEIGILAGGQIPSPNQGPYNDLEPGTTGSNNPIVDSTSSNRTEAQKFGTNGQVLMSGGYGNSVYWGTNGAGNSLWTENLVGIYRDSNVMIKRSDNANDASLAVHGSILSGTAGSSKNVLDLRSQTANNDCLTFRSVRITEHTTGLNWYSAAWRIQRRVDVTDQAYIQFGSGSSTSASGSDEDLVFGNTGGERLRITTAGNVGIGTTDPNDPVTSSNTAKLAVGIVTCHELYVNGTQITGSGGSGSGGGNYASYITSLSGNDEVEFTNIPSWATKITLLGENVLLPDPTTGTSGNKVGSILEFGVGGDGNTYLGATAYTNLTSYISSGPSYGVSEYDDSPYAPHILLNSSSVNDGPILSQIRLTFEKVKNQNKWVYSGSIANRKGDPSSTNNDFKFFNDFAGSFTATATIAKLKLYSWNSQPNGYPSNINLGPNFSGGTLTAIYEGEGGGGITIQDEGSALPTTATTLNFVGAGVIASGTGATKTITISGGGGSGSPAGSDKQLQFNNNGVFGGASKALYLESDPEPDNVTGSNVPTLRLEGLTTKLNIGQFSKNPDGTAKPGVAAKRLELSTNSTKGIIRTNYPTSPGSESGALDIIAAGGVFIKQGSTEPYFIGRSAGSEIYHDGTLAFRTFRKASAPTHGLQIPSTCGIGFSGSTTKYHNIYLTAPGDLDTSYPVGAAITFTLPKNTGAQDQALVTDGNGILSFKTISGSGPFDKISEGDTSAEVIDTGSNGKFVVKTDSSERFSINSDGDIFFGSDSPQLTRGVQISKGGGSLDAPTSYSLANEYLHLGKTEYGDNSNGGLYTMGFGFSAGATNGSAYLGYQETSTNGFTKGALIFATRSVTTDSAPTERLRITDSGTIEIRKNEPQIQLIDTDDANENKKTQLIHNGGNFFVDLRNGDDDGELIIRGKGGDTATEKLRINNRGTTFANHADVTLNGGGGTGVSGSVNGVINCGSSYKNGNLYASSGSWEAMKLYVYKDTDPNNVFGLGVSNGILEIHANGAMGFFTNIHNSNGNGSRTRRMTIDANGNIGAPSGSNIHSASDSRLKKNVVTLDKGLSEINSLRPVSFNWIDGYCAEETDTLYGFLAQEVQTVDSNLVHSFSSSPIQIATDPSNITQTITDPLRVDEKFIVPMLVKAVQELSAKNDALEARIAALEG